MRQKQQSSAQVASRLNQKKKAVVSPKKHQSKESKEIEEEPKPVFSPRIDFIQRNIEEAGEQRSRAAKPKQEETLFEQKHRPGEVPSFIYERKAELTARKSPPHGVQCPKGMRVLEEDEKQEAIDGLLSRKAEIEATLAKAPLRIESPSLIRNKRILEAQLADIEQSLSQLSRKYVFVPE